MRDEAALGYFPFDGCFSLSTNAAKQTSVAKAEVRCRCDVSVSKSKYRTFLFTGAKLTQNFVCQYAGHTRYHFQAFGGQGD